MTGKAPNPASLPVPMEARFASIKLALRLPPVISSRNARCDGVIPRPSPPIASQSERAAGGPLLFEDRGAS